MDRDALSRKSNVDGKSMSLDSNEELRNWRRITGADRFTEQTTLRSALTISIRKIFHHLGASTEEETQRIALVQGKSIEQPALLIHVHTTVDHS